MNSFDILEWTKLSRPYHRDSVSALAASLSVTWNVRDFKGYLILTFPHGYMGVEIRMFIRLTTIDQRPGQKSAWRHEHRLSGEAFPADAEFEAISARTRL